MTLPAVAWALFLAAVPEGQAARPFALPDALSFAEVTELEVSRDGRQAAFVVRRADLSANAYATTLWRVDLGGGEPARPLVHRSPVSSLRFSPDSREIGFIVRRGEAAQVWVVPAAGGESRPLTAHGEPVAFFEWSPDGRQIVFAAAAPRTADENRRHEEKDDARIEGRHWRNDRLWLAPAAGGAAGALTDGVTHVHAAAWSPDGARIALATSPNAEADSRLESRLEILDPRTGRLTVVPGSGLGTGPAWSPDGRTLAFARPHDGRDFSRQDLHLWDISSAAPRNVSAALDRDVDGFWWRPDGRALDLHHAWGAVSALTAIDASDGRRRDRLWSPPSPLGLVAAIPDGFAYVPADRPAEILIAGRRGEKARPLTSLNPHALALDLPRPQVMRWRGPAGEVEGVLIGPREAKGRRPLILNPHGGPRDHSQAAFDVTSAYFASLGYLVLRPNFRGSTGYGDAFARANVGDWGDGPFRDMMAGADALVSDGRADADRIFLYGWSYGGYLANWAVTHSARLKAAASGAGVADLRMQYVLSDARRWRFDYMGGSPFDGHLPTYERLSPITYAADARTPTLFLHGAEDERCPLAQGLMMSRALRDRGVETDLVVYPREGHSFREPRHVLDRMKRIAEWFRRHDPGANR